MSEREIFRGYGCAGTVFGGGYGSEGLGEMLMIWLLVLACNWREKWRRSCDAGAGAR